VAGIFLVWSPAGALFAIGASALMLVFIGIHNAWDTVMYVTSQFPSAPPCAGDPQRAAVA
jgi:hypothetical protein